MSASRFAALFCEAQTTTPARSGMLNSLLTIFHLAIKLKPVESHTVPEDRVDRNDRIAILTLFGRIWNPAVAHGPFAGSAVYLRLGVRGL